MSNDVQFRKDARECEIFVRQRLQTLSLREPPLRQVDTQYDRHDSFDPDWLQSYQELYIRDPDWEQQKIMQMQLAKEMSKLEEACMARKGWYRVGN
jgi:hypothetical protein